MEIEKHEVRSKKQEMCLKIEKHESEKQEAGDMSWRLRFKQPWLFSHLSPLTSHP
ncbi:MAG: hypothetical protein IJL54_11105 [Prevotella sp.]|nr:hypothetical protein [Prevotella sp.]